MMCKFSLSSPSSWDASGQYTDWIMELFDLDQLTIQRRDYPEKTLLSKPIEKIHLRANAFYSKYDFELYSNFTFFLRTL
jgi:hypothetical protein